MGLLDFWKFLKDSKNKESHGVKIVDYSTYLRRELYQGFSEEMKTANAMRPSCDEGDDFSEEAGSLRFGANEKIRECERKIGLILVSMK